MLINARGQFIKVPIKKRFWNKINKSGPLHPTNPELGSCWLWTGMLNKDQYGIIWAENHRRKFRAHRVAWELINGKIPKDKHVLHSCDNPSCVNPSHLKIGGYAENSRDMVMRNRSLIGERNPSSLLSEDQIKDIISKYPLSNKTGPRATCDRKIISELCKKHKISKTYARRIARRERWKHVL